MFSHVDIEYLSLHGTSNQSILDLRAVDNFLPRHNVKYRETVSSIQTNPKATSGLISESVMLVPVKNYPRWAISKQKASKAFDAVA